MLKLLLHSFLKCQELVEAKKTSMYIELLGKEMWFYNFHSTLQEKGEASKSGKGEMEEPEGLCLLLGLKHLLSQYR